MASGGIGGLPHYVLTFLCHMESYKDFLKWNITEGSHKLTLTLTWNFRRNKTPQSLWEKLQRAMHLGRFSESARVQSIPSDLCRFLEESSDERRESRSLDGRWVPFRWTTSKHHNHLHDRHHHHLQQQQQLQQRHHHHHQQQELDRSGSRFSLTTAPATSGRSNSHRGSGSSQLLRTHCRPRIRSFSSYHNLPARLAHGADRSPLHFSWTGASLEASSTEAVEDLRSCTATSPGRTEKLSPSSTLRHGSVTSRSVICRRESERTEEDDDDDDDDLTERSSDDVTTTSASVSTSLPSAAGGRSRYEALMSALDQEAGVGQGGDDGLWPPWSSLLFHGKYLSLGGGPTGKAQVLLAGGDSDYADAGGSDTTDADSDDGDHQQQQPRPQQQTVNQTVMRCLDSCDKILYRHSTTIT